MKLPWKRSGTPSHRDGEDRFARIVLGKIADSPASISAFSSIIAIVSGLIVGFVIMLIVNPGDAVPGFLTILFGWLSEGSRSVGDMLYYGVPIVLTGLSVAFAFRTGLFNIGATGQLTMGAFTAVYIGVNWGFLGPLHWSVAVLGGMVAGAIWGGIAGLLKAFRNVHEVVSSIMLNYIAMYVNTMLIMQLIYNRQYARAVSPLPSALIPTWFLRDVFPGSSVNIGIFIAIGLTVLLHIILNRTVFGYELKSVGFNREAAKYAGMNAKRNIVLSMTISGALAGTAGAIMFLVAGRHLEPVNQLMQEGFTGIAIALLGLSAPVGVFLAGLFYGALEQGGYYLQLFDFMPEIIDIIIAVIIYFSAFSLFIQAYVAEYLRRRLGAEVQLPQGATIK
jgi:general nucleoside transport system permease protein